MVCYLCRTNETEGLASLRWPFEANKRKKGHFDCQGERWKREQTSPIRDDKASDLRYLDVKGHTIRVDPTVQESSAHLLRQDGGFAAETISEGCSRQRRP